MAETAVGFVINYLTSSLTKEANLLRSFHSEVLGIKHDLESIQWLLKEADQRAEAESDTGTPSDGFQPWLKQLREVSFRIEDVIDEYKIHFAQHPPHESRLNIKSLCKLAGCIVKLKPRHRIASHIQDLKIEVHNIKDRRTTYGLDTTGERSTTAAAVSWYDPRKGALYLEESEVVGIESPRDELIGWLLDDQQSQRTAISIVGMGGLGKTTLAKKVYDSVKEKFDCHAWIAVSQSYQKEELLKDVMKKFCEGNNESIPKGIDAMDEEALTNKLRDFLQKKRYVVIFDDVWKVDFWGDIEHALLDNKNGGRIVITTRNLGVADFCKISSFVYVLELQPLPPEKAWELFCNKVFRFGHGGHCPTDLMELSHKILYKCHGVPLAIVAIAGLLSTKNKTVDEWRKLHDCLSSELESNPHLICIKRILSLSYNDLPHHLKSCLLYFGIYPKAYSIKSSRLIRQWIAEGFVNEKKNKTLDEVAYEYLNELIYRRLVQVSRVHEDLTGKPKECRIHDLLCEVVLRKMQDSRFCHILSENVSTFSENLVTRRLSIANTSNDVFLNSIDQISCQVRSILTFNIGDRVLLLDICNILITKPKNFKLLKVLDFEDGPLDYVHEDIGNLFHLRYLSLRNTKVKMLPSSIGKLVNLETLDVKQSFISEIPAEINRLRKLRHLFGYAHGRRGIKVQVGIGCLKFLQTLQVLSMNEIDVDVIKELRNLTQMRKLVIQQLRTEDGKLVCECIEKMIHLQQLEVTATRSGYEFEIIDLESMSSPPRFLQRLCLQGRLSGLPEWITKLQNLSRLWICWSELEYDPIETLKFLNNLVELRFGNNTYQGEQLRFEKGVFPKLKILDLTASFVVKTLIIEEGALANLEKLYIGPCSPHMEEVPSGIHHLKNLKFLIFFDLPEELVDTIRPQGEHRRIVEHVPLIIVRYMFEGQSFNTLRL
ncbi:hypothetical protein FNV43_RR17565 [Rhamnella rubrinervis]|uniref:Disease resistance protein RPM1-like n=1 Tax=Rhamnella rubrinervis TaxID=2594499 RepID=A0A8K0E3Y8_9ROSA|nr:hypothetical protein FNV43_RR17565 [Rhamnella rubrinervis]